MPVFFAFFVGSGFCGLLYEVVWTRLALASFGVTTTIVSVVLSVFMLGLALGSWLSGWAPLLRWLGSGRRFLRAYALVELGIGSGAFAVPFLFGVGRSLLLRAGATDSESYHLVSALLVGAALLPWATLLGATYALALGALRVAAGRTGGFSALYAANVLGAALGTIVTALVLIELLGFHGTLAVAAVVNVAIAVVAWVRAGDASFAGAVPLEDAPAARGAGGGDALVILFATGFVSMAMELVWTRLFSYDLGTFVYAFAAILAVYLVATYFGARAYRRALARGGQGRPEIVCVWLGGASLLPLLTADPRLIPAAIADDVVRGPWAVAGIAPLCVLLGYLTPLLVDRHAGGHPGRAARGYGVNVVGCILGPLAAGYLLLPALGERASLVLLAVALLAVGFRVALRAGLWRPFVASAACVAVLGGFCRTYADGSGVVLRDTTATVVAEGDGMDKRLLVNGVGITRLTPVTKVMAHLPMALVPAPRRALVICFGMGTTMRALASWGVDVTAVDLVPSVPALFGYFFRDAAALVGSPRVHIEIDDGRRFLDRGRDLFDVITIDPPPPMAAAGSSLLYSREMVEAVRRRLAPGGVFQQWIWTEDPAVLAAAVKSIALEFPYVVAFRSKQSYGTHVLASAAPIEVPSGTALAARLPAAARADLVEWQEGRSAEAILDEVLRGRRSAADLVGACADVAPLTDDRPLNEYFLVRRVLGASCR